MRGIRIVVSPAKKMNFNDSIEWRELPVFLKEAQILKEYISGLSYEKAKELWKCNDKIAGLNYSRFMKMDLKHGLTPAVLSYEGIQYQYMSPKVMDQGSLEYIQEHLRILSGFYGVLKPFDGIVPYRLEMQAKVKVNGNKDLYSFWRDQVYREVVRASNHVIINLASKEYSMCMKKWITEDDRFITVIFGELNGSKIVQKGMMAKMARGEMVRYMAEKKVNDPEEMKMFDRLGYEFREEYSDSNKFVFIKEVN